MRFFDHGVLYASFLFLCIGCLVNSEIDPNFDSNQNSSSALASNATLDDFSGEATTGELAIMLSNSNLECRLGDILEFNGAFWRCRTWDSKTADLAHPGIEDNANNVALTISPSGNIGINHQNPSQALEIGGTAGVDGIKFPDGTIQTSASQSNFIRDASRNLIVRNGANPRSQISVIADELILQDTTGNSLRLSSVNVTADITQYGVNGLDTGSESDSTWYHVWIISDGDTKSALLSTSNTNPILPSGFNYRAYVGAAYNDSLSDFISFHQYGNKVRRTDLSILSGGIQTAYSPLNLSASVPPNARFVNGRGGLSTSTGGTNYEGLLLRPQASSTLGQVKLIEYSEAGEGFDSATGPQWEFEAILTSAQTLYYSCYSYRYGTGTENCSGGETSVEVTITGWTF